MNLEETLSFIHSTDWKGSRLGLERIRELLYRLGNPERSLKFVHVAGTNGKGSTCAVIASVLHCAGYKTGLYTSPHLVTVNERMSINGTDISDQELIAAAEAVKAAVSGMGDSPTEFEIITAMGLWYFAQQHCDIVVLEVGLGGRLDATNVIDTPEVGVITNLGLDHTEILGDTLEKIAVEKAGILKTGCAAVTYRSEDEALNTLERICRERGIPLRVARFEDLTVRSRSICGQVFDWREYRELELSLAGEYQLYNAVTAMEALLLLRERGWNISDEALREGLRSAAWPARFALLSRDPLFLADGAHNPQCTEALVRSLDRFLPGEKAVFLTGVLADKDYPVMMDMLLPRAKAFVCLTPDSHRALPAEQLAAHLRSKGGDTRACASAAEGVTAALETAGGAPVVACGSLYLMGDVLSAFPARLKGFLRRHALRARRAVTPEERAARSSAIVERICQSDAYKRAGIIMSYAAMPDEADLSALHTRAAEDGKTLAFPCCLSRTKMVALCPSGPSAWRVGRLGILEPDPDRSLPVAPENIDLVLCPCAAFDEEGNRLGMGGGYYDRFLGKCVNARVAAVAWELQKLPSVGAGRLDVPMEEIFTEDRTYLCRQP